MRDKKLSPADFDLLQRQLDEEKRRSTSMHEQINRLRYERDKLEGELRPHRDQAERDKRKLIGDLTRLEALVTTHVKDPALRPAAFKHALALQYSGSWGPWGWVR